MKEIKDEQQEGKILNQKLDDIIEDSKSKTAALKKILKGLEDLNEKGNIDKRKSKKR